MSLRRLGLLFFVYGGVLAYTGCGNSVQSDSADLVGGRVAEASELRSALIIESNCTVSKVGPRHILTAAHCVLQPNPATGLRSMFEPGSYIRVSALNAPDGRGGFKTVEIERTVANPDFAAGQNNIRVLGHGHPPDVAVIVLTERSAELLSDVPSARVDLSPVADGEALWLTGYGCENGLNNGERYPTGRPRLKIHKTVALEADVLKHDGSFISWSNAEPVHERYVITPGKLYQDDAASLCPGDSGGPVYRADRAGELVVGINAYYSFKPRFEDSEGIAYTNWHTRLDATSPWAVGPWLEALGVEVTERGSGGGGAGQGGSNPGQGGSGPGGGGHEDCAQVVINEVATGGPYSGLNEYVELYNAGSCGVSLEGYRFEYSPASGTFTQVYWTGTYRDGIAPGSFYTIGGPDFEGLSWGYGELKSGLSSKGGGLALYGPGKERRDSITWGEAASDHPYTEGSKAGDIKDNNTSASRLGDGNDTNDNSQDFTLATKRTPGASNQR